ncbi:MAG: hypothetical protein QM831_46170 [Kofleriaceae bacterium]
MSRNWHYCVGDHWDVRIGIRERFAPPVFVESPDVSAPVTVEVFDNVVCEYGTGLLQSLLPARLANATHQPVLSVIGVETPLRHTIRTEPDGTTTPWDHEPLKPTVWKPTVTFRFVEDKHGRAQLGWQFFGNLGAFVTSLFPIRAGLARLDCKQAIASGKFWDACVVCDLQLGIFKDVGVETELVDLRTETVTLCSFVWNRDLLFDEQLAAFEQHMRTWTRSLKQRLADTRDWTGVTPSRFLELY